MSQNSSKFPDTSPELRQQQAGYRQLLRSFLAKRWWMVIMLPLWMYVGFMLAELLVEGSIGGLEHLGVQLQNMNQTVFSTIISAITYIITGVIVIGLPWIIGRQHFTGKEVGLFDFPKWMDIWLAPAGFIVYLLLSALLIFVVSQLIPGFNIGQAQNTGFQNLTVQYEYILAFVSLVIVAPVAEEFLFRGYLLGQLRKYVPVWLAVLVTSMVFGLLHLTGGNGWNLVIDTFSLSLILCVLRIITKSLWAPILLHMIKNGVAFYLLFIIPFISGTLGG